MLRFIETIRVADGKAENLAGHQMRLNMTHAKFFPEAKRPLLINVIPQSLPMEVSKLRVVYRNDIEEVSIEPYTPREIRSLRLVECNDIDYEYKSTDRSMLNAAFKMRNGADDVLIVRRGLITDTSIANVAFRNYDGVWFTPKRPLLKGTRLQRLIERGDVIPLPIMVKELKNFSHISIFNALIPFGSIVLPTDCIEE